jgi:hypothetical protein
MYFPASSADLTKNIQRHYEMYSVLWPIRMAAAAIQKICKYCGRIFGSASNLHFRSLFNYMNTLLNNTSKFECYSFLEVSVTIYSRTSIIGTSVKRTTGYPNSGDRRCAERQYTCLDLFPDSTCSCTP